MVRAAQHSSRLGRKARAALARSTSIDQAFCEYSRSPTRRANTPFVHGRMVNA